MLDRLEQFGGEVELMLMTAVTVACDIKQTYCP